MDLRQRRLARLMCLELLDECGKRRDRAVAPVRGPIPVPDDPPDVDAVRAIGDNHGSMLLKGATHNLIVRTRAEVALYVLNHKRAHLRALEERFRISITVSADPTVTGQQSYVIDRGEQVHTLEAAKALLAAQAAASPPQVEEAYDDEEAFDVETESEVETEETEGLTDDAAEAAGGEGEGDGR